MSLCRLAIAVSLEWHLLKGLKGNVFAKRTHWELVVNRYTEAVARFKAAHRELLDLTVSNPTDCELTYRGDVLLSTFQNPGALHYDPQPKGLLSAREAVASYYREHLPDSAAPLNPENILLTTSTSEAYSFIFRLLCEAGDEVLIAQPSYPLFEFLAEICDVKLVRYPLVYDYGWQIDFHGLEKAIGKKTKAVVVVHPNNPTGSYVKVEERARLSAWCAERELAIIADEVFLDYPLERESERAPSFCTGKEALTFSLSGLSKISGLPQMKVAWLVGSGPALLVTEAMSRLEVISDTYLSLSTPAQLALPPLLEERRSFQAQLQSRLRLNLRELDAQLQRQSHCSRQRVEGGWNAVLRVPAIRTDEELAIALLESEGVLVQPGHFYDFPSEGYLVLSLITPPQILEAGLQRLLRFLN